MRALRAPVVIIMGVAGCGKTTVGKALAAARGWRFVDADDHHAPASVAKMASGVPLTDADRWPWLDQLRGIIAAAIAAGEPLVLACSALKAAYRARLVGGDGDRVRFVHLTAAPDVLRARLEGRASHFMKPGMLASQLATLEPPADALTLDAAQSPEALVAAIIGWLER
jgi:gluconokinase